jgi:hypothetical protein
MNKQLLSFNVMTAVQTSYTKEKMIDSEFAKKLSIILKIPVSTARVRQARAALGIKSNGGATLEEAKRHIRNLLAIDIAWNSGSPLPDQYATQRIEALEFVS